MVETVTPSLLLVFSYRGVRTPTIRTTPLNCFYIFLISQSIDRSQSLLIPVFLLFYPSVLVLHMKGVSPVLKNFSIVGLTSYYYVFGHFWTPFLQCRNLLLECSSVEDVLCSWSHSPLFGSAPQTISSVPPVNESRVETHFL